MVTIYSERKKIKDSILKNWRPDYLFQLPNLKADKSLHKESMNDYLKWCKCWEFLTEELESNLAELMKLFSQQYYA